MENKWEDFAKNFEQSNNYVVGIDDINRVKQRLARHRELGDVLELGCGNGTYTSSLLASAKRVVATDVSQPMLEVTKIRFEQEPKVVVEPADCFALSYQDASFDTVFMANLLHVIPNPAQALHECMRVLKPGGQLIAVSFTLHDMSFFNKLGLKYRYLRKYGSKKSNNSIVMTPVLAHELAASAGLQNIATEMLGQRVKAVHLSGVKSE
ncbi:class I SAM-dependent methyltransferase [Vibrio fluminensis]|uniref:class I SAM-dependent methyltransferase n=1 Tax=Vibrio fluminensis TaxID=2783614 RepID=UPI00188704D4|nr:methyltransferase domain-containing protein [Vibrio fluminensis]